MPHLWLIGLAEVRHSLIFDGSFHFDCRSKLPHSPIIEIVVIAEPLSLFQICARAFRGFSRRNNFGIVGHLVFQTSPFDIQTRLADFQSLHGQLLPVVAKD